MSIYLYKLCELKYSSLLYVLVVFCSAILFIASPFAAAMDEDQRNTYSNGIHYYDVKPRSGNCLGSVGTVTTPGDINTSRVKSFATMPITSTWDIPDNVVETWFLKQAGARSTIKRYKLDKDNIGVITATVKAANVSPVFFYLYAVNEGGGAGGFINHFKDEVRDKNGTVDGVANAKRDAEYLATYSKDMDLKPAWIDAGNPVDFVPQAVKDAGNTEYKNLPSGTIGRIYIAATAAATWEMYYPNGLKKEFNKVQDYGAPLSAAMRNVEKMGGDPLKGGVALSSEGCATGVAGEGMQKGINFAKTIANNDGYGYDQPGRTTGWQKWQSDPNCTKNCGSFDCSSFVSAILTVAGYYDKNPNFRTADEEQSLLKAGFKKIANSAKTSKGLQPGDILHKVGHTEMYIGNDQNVGASINENNGTAGGQVGDQTGKEIYVKPFWDDDWTGVFRAPY